MNNRDWLNTLSDEEYNELVDIDSSIICSDKRCSEYADKNSNGNETTNCTRCQLAWLSQPHETTADEDFAEIGFYQMNFTDFGKPSEVVSYGFGDDKYMVAIYKDGQNVYTADTGLRWTDELIDQIRTIADKKRKEMGWDK